jgi:hypothetical protein
MERRALANGGMMVAAPKAFTPVLGRTREERLAEWEKMLGELDQKHLAT